MFLFCLFHFSRICGFVSDSIQSEQTRSSSENLPFSISRLLSKPFENNNKTSDKELLDAEHKFATQLANVGIPYSTASALYSYPLYAPGQVLRVPPQRTPLSWALPPMHPAALAHQAVKDRLAGKWKSKNFFCFARVYLFRNYIMYVPIVGTRWYVMCVVFFKAFTQSQIF